LQHIVTIYTAYVLLIYERYVLTKISLSLYIPNYINNDNSDKQFIQYKASLLRH